MVSPDPVNLAARVVGSWLGGRQPAAIVVLGSGLGGLVAELGNPARLAYESIPGFPRAAVAGHAGELVAGSLHGQFVVCQSGRFHAYEGHSATTLALPVRVFAALGTRVVLLTNAAGGLRLSPGSLMLIADQLNLTFRNPLIGRVQGGEARFPDMSEPYDTGLRALALETARAEGIALQEGVYAGVAGPSYETAAEIRMLRAAGADAVGMSTVPEVIACRARGLRVLGISVVTNWAAGIGSSPLSHEEVVTAADAASERLRRLVGGILRRLPDSLTGPVTRVEPAPGD